MIKPIDVPDKLADDLAETIADAYWGGPVKRGIAAILNAAIEAGLVVPASEAKVLRRALRLAIFALYDEKLYVPTAADPQNYIDQARRELNSETSQHIDKSENVD
jgi:hypothetical protein